jgi:hypothetical protein
MTRTATAGSWPSRRTAHSLPGAAVCASRRSPPYNPGDDANVVRRSGQQRLPPPSTGLLGVRQGATRGLQAWALAIVALPAISSATAIRASTAAITANRRPRDGRRPRAMLRRWVFRSGRGSTRSCASISGCRSFTFLPPEPNAGRASVPGCDSIHHKHRRGNSGRLESPVFAGRDRPPFPWGTTARGNRTMPHRAPPSLARLPRRAGDLRRTPPDKGVGG